MLIAISTLAVLLILVGWKYKTHRTVHIPAMSLAFLIDLGLLLYIELNRQAIATLQKNMSSGADEALLYFHVAVSAIMLILYFVQIGTGIRLAKGREVSRVFHRNAAMGFLACRLLNYVTSFFVVSNL